MKTAISAAILASCPLSLSAATLSVTNVTGQWTSVAEDVAPVGENERPANAVGLNTDAVSWGEPWQGGPLSGYVFDGAASAGNLADQSFAMGTFTHNNNTIFKNSSIAEATLKVAFSFFIDADASKTFTRIAEFKFGHNETPNQTVDGVPDATKTCPDGTTNGGTGVNRNGCADEVTVKTNPRSTESFLVGGKRFVFDVTGFEGRSSFFTVEREKNSIQLFGRFTERANVVPLSAVPLPAAGALLLAAMAVMGALRARRRR